MVERGIYDAVDVATAGLQKRLEREHKKVSLFYVYR